MDLEYITKCPICNMATTYHTDEYISKKYSDSIELVHDNEYTKHYRTNKGNNISVRISNDGNPYINKLK